jgi:EAL and modified HD-GYP domain-containing signal transduction protein
MSSFFNRLMGKAAVAAPAARPVTGAPAPQTNETPDRTAGRPAPAAKKAEPVPAFACREPLLDRKECIAGYQFSMPEEVEQRLQNELEFLPRIYDDAVLRNLGSLGDDALLGPRLALVRLAPESLDNPRILQLPTTNTVLMLAPVQKAPVADAIGPQLEALRQAGYAHGWLLRQPQVEAFPGLLELSALADYVQIDATGFNGMDLKLLLKSITDMRPAGLPKLRLIAGGLSAFDEFNLYFRAGFDLFLGRFVTQRENWHPPASNVNRVRVFTLLNLLRSDTEVGPIAEEIKHDPVLAFKLLRYINSPLMGLMSPVTGLDKALIVLGREKFYRWLSLMLFDFKSPGYKERVLTEQALSRASFLERLAGQGTVPAQADWLFILGLFSNLDLLMGQAMADLLLQAKLPAAVHDALLGEAGPFGDALQLAIAAEGQSPVELQRQAALCGLHALPVSQCAMQSLAWAHEISSLDGS